MKISNFDYIFKFQSIQNKNTQVHVLDANQNKQNHFSLFIEDKELSIAGLPTVSSINADILDLAIAIHAVDRIAKRKQEKSSNFHIEIPVRNYDIFCSLDTLNLLAKILNWYTNDFWNFEFKKRDIDGREIEFQAQLPWKEVPKQPEVALWSGGLDSLAGLYTRLSSENTKNYVLIGTGSNSQVIKKQKQLANGIDNLFPNRTLLVQVPYKWLNTPKGAKNFIQRSRGLVFSLIGAVCANHLGSKSLYIYENGIGAINLPYTKSSLGVDQGKSVHPISLKYTSDLLSMLFGFKFEVTNPFWLSTKQQMVSNLIVSKRKDLIKLSSSCDRIHRLETGLTQCGICTSCLLRRLSLETSGFNDPTIYDHQSITNSGTHFKAMQNQVKRIEILLKEKNPWVKLSKEYHELDDIVDQFSTGTVQSTTKLRKQIIELYSNHVNEWNLFEENNNKTSQVS